MRLLQQQGQTSTSVSQPPVPDPVPVPGAVTTGPRNRLPVMLFYPKHNTFIEMLL